VPRMSSGRLTALSHPSIDSTTSESHLAFTPETSVILAVGYRLVNSARTSSAESPGAAPQMPRDAARCPRTRVRRGLLRLRSLRPCRQTEIEGSAQGFWQPHGRHSKPSRAMPRLAHPARRSRPPRPAESVQHEWLHRKPIG
jgi:hypothetical protein